MRNRTLLALMLTLAFVGATSCGDDKQSQNLAAENAALRAALAQRAAAGPTTIGTTVTAIATSVVNITQTAVGTTNTNGTTATVVYTVTNGSTSTAGRQ